MQISVIIPSYKPQNYILECLDSLQKQTLPRDKWECIIILNGCNEPWYSSMKDYIQSHNLPNAKLIQTDEAGVSNARNIGLENAKGEYITFIDDDDYVSSVYLEQLLKIATPSIIAASNTVAFSEEQPYIPYYLENEYKEKASQGIMPYYHAKKYFSGPCMKLIHRNIIGDFRFDTHFKNGEDSLFMFAISCNMKYVCFTCKEAIYYRRIRIGSATQTHTFGAKLINRSLLINSYSKYFWKKPTRYNFKFYLTRILACLHYIIA